MYSLVIGCEMSLSFWYFFGPSSRSLFMEDSSERLNVWFWRDLGSFSMLYNLFVVVSRKYSVARSEIVLKLLLINRLICFCEASCIALLFSCRVVANIRNLFNMNVCRSSFILHASESLQKLSSEK